MILTKEEFWIYYANNFNRRIGPFDTDTQARQFIIDEAKLGEYIILPIFSKYEGKENEQQTD